MALQLSVCLLASASLFAGTHVVHKSRNAVADVKRVGEGFSIAVEFAPVRSFGAAKDAEINRNLARDYALRGLAREFGDSNVTDMSAKGLQSEYSRLEEGRWKALFHVASVEREMSKANEPEVETAVAKSEAVPESQPLAPALEEPVSDMEKASGIAAADSTDIVAEEHSEILSQIEPEIKSAVTTEGVVGKEMSMDIGDGIPADIKEDVSDSGEANEQESVPCSQRLRSLSSTIAKIKSPLPLPSPFTSTTSSMADRVWRRRKCRGDIK